ncbi:MAG: helix-turn-helix transcriptional regulator [Pseudomonadota bacterium]
MIRSPIARPAYAQVIAGALRQLDWTSKDAAAKIGVSPSMMSMFANGRRVPNEANALRISEEMLRDKSEKERFLFLVELARRISFEPRTQKELEIYVEFEFKLIENFEKERVGQDNGKVAQVA